MGCLNWLAIGAVEVMGRFLAGFGIAVAACTHSAIAETCPARIKSAVLPTIKLYSTATSTASTGSIEATELAEGTPIVGCYANGRFEIAIGKRRTAWIDGYSVRVDAPTRFQQLPVGGRQTGGGRGAF